MVLADAPGHDAPGVRSDAVIVGENIEKLANRSFFDNSYPQLGIVSDWC